MFISGYSLYQAGTRLPMTQAQK